MTIDQIIRSVQTELNLEVDGVAGPQTWTAIYRKIVGVVAEPVDISRVDDRSEKNIATLLPEVRPYARALVQEAAAIGLTIKVLSGTRTYAEQDALFNQRPQVTKARGGFSNHNFGIAFDVGLFSGTKYVPESPSYKAIGALGVKLGLEWGGNWKSFVDEPHFQLRPTWAEDLHESQMLGELRKRKAEGSGVFV